MTFKRHIDRLPIIPTDAKEHNVTCQFCIVGCGYHAYTWPINEQGGAAANANVFGVDLTKQQPPMTPNWYSPSMYNIVKQDGKDVHLVIKPDPDCSVNSGLASIRGARMAEESFSPARSTQQQRLTEPMVWRYGQMQPTSWDDALDLVARVTAAVIDRHGEDDLFVSMFDHGGAGGGYENTWGTGKLYFGAMKIKNVRIHNRPAYNSEVHATRDMGVGELNNCYEDAELADTIMAVGTNSLETQTNYFLNHWIPNLQGATLDKKKKLMPDEPHPATRIIFVDPRRTVTINACEVEAGKNNVLHLAINSGTDLALFNALFTYIADKGWVQKDFIEKSTLRTATTRPPLYPARGESPAFPAHLTSFESALEGCRTSIDDAAKITGLNPADIVKAAEWIAMPKEGGKRGRTMFGYEKGLIWGNDNYRTNGAYVNLALATGNVGQMGGGVVRMGGHQEGYVRPDYPGPRPAPYIDKLLIEGKGGVHHIWDCDHYKTTLNADQFKQTYKKRTDLVKDAMSAVPYGDRKATVDAILAAIDKGGLFSVDVDIVPTKIGQACHVWLPGGDRRRDESDLDERRAPAASDRALYGPARPVPARLPDRSATGQQPRTRVPRTRASPTSPTSSRASTGRPRKTPSWTAITPMRRAASSSPMNGCAPWGLTASRSRRPASRTASSSERSVSTPMACSQRKTARPGSWTRRGAGSRRRARNRNRRSSHSSSTMAAPITSGRAPISTSRKISSWIAGPIRSSR